MGKLLASHTGQGSPVRESSHLFPTLQDRMEPMQCIYMFSVNRNQHIFLILKQITIFQTLPGFIFRTILHLKSMFHSLLPFDDK